MYARRSIWRFEFNEDPKKHVVLLEVNKKEKDQYFDELKQRIAKSSKSKAFIFIHGYNVTFEDAARRTAQMSYDLAFDGAPVFYSWPSQGVLSGYLADETNIAWSQTNLKQFIKDFVDRTEAENIYLIAHSMGNRALTGAVTNLVRENPDMKKRFREIILAAPDIDAGVFKRDIAPVMLEASPNVTLYASADDNALKASKKIRGYARAGDAGENILIMDGVETIDATGVDASLLAHSYFAESRSIIADLLSIIRDGRRASSRSTLSRIVTQRGSYWSIAK